MVSIAFIPAGTVPLPQSTVVTSIKGKKTSGGMMLLRPLDESIANLQASPGWFFPGCAGHALRIHWSTLEPSNGVFNWAYLDAAFALAAQYNKKISFNIIVGVNGTPSWFTPGTSITFSTGTVPAPWDSGFQTAFGAAISAAGARYDSNPYLSYVDCHGMGASGAGTALFCSTTGDDTIFFNLFGGNATTAVATWVSAAVTLIGFYKAAFPNTPLSWNIGHTLGDGTAAAFNGFYEAQEASFRATGIGIKNVNLNPNQSPQNRQNVLIPFYAAMGSKGCGFQEEDFGFSFATIQNTLAFAATARITIYEGYQSDFQLLSWSPLIQQYNQIFQSNYGPTTQPAHAGAGFQFGPY
jgi:hypothetical protein